MRDKFKTSQNSFLILNEWDNEIKLKVDRIGMVEECNIYSHALLHLINVMNGLVCGTRETKSKEKRETRLHAPLQWIKWMTRKKMESANKRIIIN